MPSSFTCARVLVNGVLSEPWDERAGVRQGSVLGSLLFNILFDGISAAVRAACRGVSLGRGPRAPRVTLLLYADDLVVLAESEAELQRALDAIGAWGTRWRFSFGIGPEKTAVPAVGCRSCAFRFTLQGSVVPVVSEYRYLGVVLQASKEWSKQTDRLRSKSTRKFYQCVAWAEGRGLHTSFRRSLFHSYVLPSLTYGAAFLDDASVRRLDKHARQLGRRLLNWPSRSPGAAVLGELGWDPFAVQVLRVQASLFGHLCSATPGVVHRGLAARVFRYAVGIQSSLAARISLALRSAGVTLPAEFGLGPGSDVSLLQRWRHRCVRPALDGVGLRLRRAEASQVASLATFLQCHPNLDFSPCIHASRLPSSVVREWTLARCGHHPFLDGRVARHSNLDYTCLCGSADWSLIHALRTCPLFLHLRRTWLQRLKSRHYDVDLLSDDSLLRFILAPHGMGNTRSSAHAHVLFVAGVCQAQRSLLEGLGI